MIRVLAALVVCLWAAPSPATLRVLSGFDGVDQTNTNTNTYEWSPFRTADANVNVVGIAADARAHQDANGGTSSSKWSLRATAASGEYGYYRLATDLSSSFDRAVAFNLHVQTPPASGQRRLVACIAEATTNPPDCGCALALNSDRTLTLLYVGGTGTSCSTDANCTAEEACLGGICRQSWGTTPNVLQANACSTDPLRACTAATVAADCPGVSPTCPSTQYYYGGLSLRQVTQSAAVVTCNLGWNGRPVFSGVSKTIPGQPVRPAPVNVALGVLNAGTTTGAATVYIDDVVVADAEDPGFGYVARKVPSQRGIINQWNEVSCGSTGVVNVRCIDDYNVSSFLFFNSSSNDMLRRAERRIEEFAASEPTLIVPTGTSVPAVEAVVFGNDTTGSGTRALALGVMVCPPGSCNGSTCQNAGATGRVCTSDVNCCVESLSDQNTRTGAGSTTLRTYGRYMVSEAPVPGVDRSWAQYVNALGLKWETGSATNEFMRIGAALLYVRVKREPAISPTLRDHNLGTDDGKVSVCAIGDSTLVGTVETACIGGTNAGVSCTQPSYCHGGAWAPEEKDKPTGGCNLSAAATVCDTCTGSRLSFPAGLGLACTVDSDCTSPICNLTTGFCEQTDGTQLPIACTSSAQCNLGTCDTEAECIESCPGGSCPSGQTGWAGSIPSRITADVVYSCGLGGEQFSEMYVNRFWDVLSGAEANCEAKSGTGVCQCTTGTDCGTGGICTAGLCTGGDANRRGCVKNTDCQGPHPGGKLCQFPPCDYPVILEGYNEHNVHAGVLTDAPIVHAGVVQDPECTRLASTRSYSVGRVTAPCPNWGNSLYTVPATACTSATECTASPEQTCDVGWCLDNGTNTPCWVGTGMLPGNQLATGCTTCSTATLPCDEDGDCAVIDPQQICVRPSPTFPRAHHADGVCRCTSDAGCPAGYVCAGDAGARLCRKTCSLAADCELPATTCAAIGTGLHPEGATNVCQARCSAPCDAIACTTDRDCGPPPMGTIAFGVRQGHLRRMVRSPGICNKARGRCTACGLTLCGTQDVLTGPCSCASNTDCDSSPTAGDGVCDTTLNRCTAPIGTSHCLDDRSCPTGQCLRASRQFADYRQPFAGLHLQVSRSIWSELTARAAEGDTVPAVLFTGLPMLGGLTSIGSMVPDAECYAEVLGAFYTRDNIATVTQDLMSSELPARRLIDFRSNFDLERMKFAYHTDQVHFSPLGASRVGEIVADGLNRLNVCVQADGLTPQRYCQNANETFSSTPCTTTAQCTAGQTCERRRCDGNDAACPDAGDSCGAD